MSCSETAQPIDLPFGLWTQVGRRKHKFSLIRQMAPMCPHGRAHWRHLANTVEPSVCCGDVVLCQITLTTYFLFSVACVFCQLNVAGLIVILHLFQTCAFPQDRPKLFISCLTTSQCVFLNFLMLM